MDSQRSLAVVVLLLLSLVIWQIWKSDHATYINSRIKNIHINEKFAEIENKRSPINHPGKIITIKTDVLLLKINTYGGDIEQAFLLSYPEKIGSSRPFHLLKTSSNFLYQAQSGLIGKNGLDNSTDGKRPLYNSERNSYILKNDQNELHVPLHYIAKNGVAYTKTFILRRNNFHLNVNYNIDNTSNKSIELILFGQLKQSVNLDKVKDPNKNFSHSYRGAAYSTEDNKYQKYSFKDIRKKRLSIHTKNGWIAMVQQYFVTAWVPLTFGKNTFYTMYLKNEQAVIGFKSSPIIIHPKHQTEITSILWIGPEIQDKMANISPYLDLTVDYGWLWFISQPLLKLLKLINGYCNNWGISIIVTTFIVRIVMYPLTKSQYISVAKLRMLQPKLTEIRERLQEDKNRQTQEIMELYRREKINPMGGCLPVMIQMPIFLALYYMLSGSIELRHSPFLWIRDLSSYDPYYILPTLMGISMIYTQKMSNTVTDPTQKNFLTIIPIIFTIFFLWLPAGLVLYYIISNLVAIVQHYLISYDLENK